MLYFQALARQAKKWPATVILPNDRCVSKFDTKLGQQKINGHKYLIANEADAAWGLYVTTIGFQSIAPDSDYPPRDHPSAYWFNPDQGRVLQEYQIIYLMRGEGLFHSASVETRAVGEGSIILLFPGEWHSFYPKKKAMWESYWIGFNGQNIEELAAGSFFQRSQPIIDIGFNEQLVGLFDQGIEIANAQKTAFQPMLAGITQLLLSVIFYSDRNNSFRDKDIVTKIEQARVIMRKNVVQHPDPEKIAAQLNMSYSWFRRVFKQYTGLSPAQYQMEIRVQKAKELLTSTSMAVKEIAYELNFESSSHFVTFFKGRAGLSPGAYRDKVHTNPSASK